VFLCDLCGYRFCLSDVGDVADIAIDADVDLGDPLPRQSSHAIPVIPIWRRLEHLER